MWWMWQLVVVNVVVVAVEVDVVGNLVAVVNVVVV